MQSSANEPKPHGPELLSPAGDWESLKAAVANGADAVYFGLSRFSARARATNFAPRELPAVFDYLREHNTRGYVAFNTLLFDEELPEAAGYVEAIAAAGADAVIIQDIGLLKLIRRMAPSLPIHASTQMTQTHSAGLRILKEWGVSRAILARELSMTQIRRIRSECAIELEVFVHGAICISFSGQCLASRTIFGRSGNRGQCAQACRLPYEIIVDGKPIEPPAPPYPLSPLDLCAIGRIGDLAEAGVAGLKIEGRLKSAEYVATATRAYRDAIDAACGIRQAIGDKAAGDETAGGKAPIGEAAASGAGRSRLAKSFSRGFTEGFLGGVGHGGLVDGQSPKGRGVRIGKVAGIGRDGIQVALEPGAEIRPGDGVVFAGEPRPDEQGGRVYSVEPVGGRAIENRADSRSGRPAIGNRRKHPSNRIVEIAFGTGAVDPAAVAVGEEVWKTDDPIFRREVRQTYSRDVCWRKRRLDVKVAAKAGGPLRISARDAHGLSARAEWPGPLEASSRHPLTEEVIREQFSRLGGTPYELGGVELESLDSPGGPIPVMAPKSVLNALRREVVDKLRLLRAESKRHKIAEPDSLNAIKSELLKKTYSDLARIDAHPDIAAGALECPPHIVSHNDCESPNPVCAESAHNNPRLCVLVRTLAQMEATARYKREAGEGAVSLAYCDMAHEALRREAMAMARESGIPAAAATTVVLMPGEERLLEKLAGERPDAVLVRNLAAAGLLKTLVPGLPLIGDYHLNAANAISASALLDAGLIRVTACMDLDAAQLPAILDLLPAPSIEVVIRLHVPMFHTAHCFWAANMPGGPECEACHGHTPGCHGHTRSAADGHAIGTCPSPRQGGQAATGNGMAPGHAPAGPSGGAGPCRQHKLRIRDRKGEEHLVLADEAGRNTTFQSRARSIVPPAGAPSRLSGWLRVELLDESAEETLTILRRSPGGGFLLLCRP